MKDGIERIVRPAGWLTLIIHADTMTLRGGMAVGAAVQVHRDK
jgi:hypothetical protein